jgi:Icc-related predicted phosphoesterase
MPLRALCASDLHGDVAAARRVGARALAGGIELVLSAGDLGVDGSNDVAVYEALARGGVPILSVPGNHDGDEYDRIVAGLGWTDLHERVVERGGWWFAGFGLRDWDGSTDAGHEAGLVAFLSTLEGIPPQRLVLVTHVPPLGTLAARDRRFVDHGSRVLADWIAARQPAVCVCGHVHHREPLIDRLGETLIVNAGPHGYELTR